MKGPTPHILIRSVNWLGDAVMTVPALRMIRGAIPDAKISILTPCKLAGLWEGQPFVDAVIPFEKKASLFNVAALIRQAEAEAALILPNSPRSAIEAWLGRVPLRVGVCGKWRRFFLTHPLKRIANTTPMRKRTEKEVLQLVEREKRGESCIPKKILPHSHQLYHYIHLATALIQHWTGKTPEQAPDLTPHLTVSEEEQKQVCQRFGIEYSEHTSWLGVNAGAEYGPAKRWPLECFAQTMATITHYKESRWILLGGPGDMALANELQKKAEELCPGILIYCVTGKMTLRELTVLASLCRVVVTNDTGPMHVAAAAGATVAVPFLSTSPELTCPGSPLDDRAHPNKHLLVRPEQCPCSPCFLRQCPIDFRCAQQVSVGRMTSAILPVLEAVQPI